jgi:hypothetical protein
MWVTNRSVSSVFTTAAFANAAWANISGGVGWRRIENQDPPGTVRLFSLLSDAATNGRNVNVFLNDTTGEVFSAELV